MSDLLAEELLDSLGCGERVLDDVVQEPGAHTRRVEPQLGDDPGYPRGMDEVRVTRLSELPLVRAIAEVVRPLDEVGVRRGVVRLNAVDEVGRLEQEGDGKANTGRLPLQGDLVRKCSVYVHFPWCLEKCPYCDFVSYKTPREAIDHARYADAVLREAELRAAGLAGRRVASVFFGGGTPSLWEPTELGRVLAGLRQRFAFDADVEVTVECNPTSLDAARAEGLARAGVDRLSIGVQSLRDPELRFLGRLHDARGALAAIRAAVASPIARVSADLIFGLPEQTPEDAAAQASSLADLGLLHLSCYQLTIEPKTRFGELHKRGKLPLATDDSVADAFLAIDEALTARGFRHYETSNYAHPGHEARHNLGYWRGEEYLGLGCGAYGFARVGRGAGVRWRNQVLPDVYMGAADPTSEREELDGSAMLRERIMLGLRLEGGFDLAAAGDDLGVCAFTPERRRTIEHLVERGRIVCDGTKLSVPGAARLFTDDTAARLF